MLATEQLEEQDPKWLQWKGPWPCWQNSFEALTNKSRILIKLLNYSFKFERAMDIMAK